MKINLKDLRSSAGQQRHFVCLELIDEEGLTASVNGDVFVVATKTSVQLTGGIQATVKLSCHRCLNPYSQFIEFDLNEEFVYEDYLNGNTLKGKDRELLKEDFFETVPYEGTIDVSDVVYQTIILAIPNYCVCGPNCAGPPIYKHSGSAQTQKQGSSDTNTAPLTDPRWHNLKTIFSNDTQNEKVSDNTS